MPEEIETLINQAAGSPDSGESQEQAPQTFDADYVAKLRAEAAKYRNEAKTAKAQLSELQPLADKAKQQEETSASDAERLARQLAEMQQQVKTAQEAATRAAAERQLVTLAVKAGVPADILPFLDVTKFDLDDEETTLATLEKLRPSAAPPTGGQPSNPARKTAPGGPVFDTDTLKAFIAGGNKSSIFGG